jgi:tRNA(fMet)-specific endonuclease VapC
VAVLIDASVLIAYERGTLDAERRVAGREDEAFLLSVITASELLHGVHRAGDPARRARRSPFVEGILDRFPVLGVNLPTARFHAELWAELAREGHLIGAHDLWLAATCLAHGLALATTDVRHFGRVPGLEVEDWGA